MNNLEGVISESFVKDLKKKYDANPLNKAVSHALSRTALTDAIYAPESLPGVDPTFSVEIKTMKATNQKQSGRCWIFAALNICREIIGRKMGIKEFELSQNYIALYDKIEKANFALESFIELCEYAPNERVFMHLLNSPVSDGGQWDMFVNLVRKYGLMPKAAFPETYQSEHTAQIDSLINANIRNFAYQARMLHLGNKKSEIRPLKEKVLASIYTLCLNAFGVPPKTFDFEYRDDKDKYHLEKGLTPLSFAKDFLGNELDNYQSLINSPTADKPYNKNYTVDYLGNVLEGKPINHVNLKMERLKEVIIKSLSDGNPVWFGSDVSFYRDRSAYAWDDNAFDYASSFGMKPEFEKGAMLDFRASAMNHAMVITGVDIKGGVPTRWKIENSWGTDTGLSGYFVMSDSWFNTFVYQAVVHKKYLSKEEVAAAESAPTHLQPWDPMGTLAD